MNNSFFIKIFPFIISFFILLLITVFKKLGKSQSKYVKLYKLSINFLVLGVVFQTIFCFVGFTTKFNRTSSTSSSSADGFSIEEYKIDMNVDESNSIDVREYITVNFYEGGHHGIYRFIPSWLEYTNKDGVTKSRESKISDLRANDDNYTIDTVSGKQRIKIGNPNYTLPVGEHTYEISYTYDMGNDPYNKFDEFIFHAFGDYWGTEIKNASVTITLPKSFDFQNKVKFFADKYRKKDITSYVDYYVSGNTIYAKLSSNYRLNSALTIDVELPEGYFVKGSNNYGIKSLFLCLICIMLAFLTFVLWQNNGKDFNKVPETVEFYPPENLDAAEIGYLNKYDTGRKLAISIIIELASKGFIKIIESEDKTKQTIVKSSITDVNKYINREIKALKLKEYRPGIFNNHYNATIIMKYYFPDNTNEAVITSDFDYFYEKSKYLVDKGYIRIESDTINNYTESQLEEIKNNLLENEFKGKPKLTSNEEIVYNRLFENTDETDLSKNYTFYNAFSEISENVRNKFDDKINDLTAHKYMLFTSIGFLVCTILWEFAYCVYEDLNPKFDFIYILALISNIATFVFSILMKRKNLYGEQLKSKINGFKNYIQLAEKNQIEMLVEQNPNYFYEILAYAYVLDISKKWVEKFDNIPVPTHDMGNFNYTYTDSLNSLSDSVYYPTSSSGSSSCGGGCSSCGGGCSSCGGGGSW